MLDNKFIFTLVGIIAAVLAISNVNIGNTENFVPPTPSVNNTLNMRRRNGKNSIPRRKLRNIQTENFENNCCSANYNTGKQTTPEEAAAVIENFEDVTPSAPASGNRVTNDAQAALPVGDMLDSEPIVYNANMSASQGSRNRSLGDLIRGDLRIKPAARCNKEDRWFQVSANMDRDLQKGGANIMFGVEEASLR